MTREERELLEQCKLQLVHIHDVVGRKQFYTTKDLIKKIDVALIIPVVSVPKGTCCLNPNIKGMVNDMHESWSECTNCKKETV